MGENSELQRCIGILKSGGLIVAPSDTVYGLVCDATNEKAVKKLFTVKNRPFGKPISVFTDGLEMIESLVYIKNKALLYTLLPGPFTIILPSKHTTCPLLESERKTLGVRYTSFSWIQQLVHKYKKPLTATSANISGCSPHYELQGFMNELSTEKRALIDHIVEGGKLPRNKPSTIIDLTGDSLELLRKGEIIPSNTRSFTSTSSDETKKIAAFLLEKYLPNTIKKPLVFILEGEMGAGKTVFAQGLGKYFGIKDIISPTYVIYYEYPVVHDKAKIFIHADLFNVEENEEFSHLGLEQYLNEKTILCVEWGNKAGFLFEQMKKKSKIIVIKIDYVNEKKRSISVKEL